MTMLFFDPLGLTPLSILREMEKREKMICKECKKKGLKSIVYPGMDSTTLMFFPPFYDEEGRFHNHDANTIITEYSCSNGHKWIETTTGSCWCGWPGKIEYIHCERKGGRIDPEGKVIE